MTALIVAIGLMTLGTMICSAQGGMMVGGYRKVAATEEAVANAAKFAVDARSSAVSEPSLALVSILSAQRQIVAGSNYQMCLSLKADGKPQQATAIVYLNLQNQFSLSKWVDGNCAAAADSSSGDETAAAAVMAPTIVPEIIVRNLYAAQKAKRGPFFQTKNRALVDKYFTKKLADLIWKDAVTSNGEVGALDGDPLYNAQDLQITQFVIGKPEYGEGNLALADVPVTFKNMGKAETILFRLEQGSGKVWKISNIFYPANEAGAASLEEILSN